MSSSTFRIDRALHSAERAVHATTGPTGTGPALTTTVPKEFVHRAGVAEVFLTDWRRAGDHQFGVAAQWPRGHGFFSNVDGHHDPLIAAETIRQVGALLAHAEYGVPLDHHFLMWDLSIAVRPDHLLVDHAPASLDIEVVCADVKWRRDTLAGLHYDTVIRRDGHIAATGSATFSCASPKTYGRLRADRLEERGPLLPLTAPTAPQNVGRVSPMDVVLSPAGGPDRWHLRVDTRHPVLFEHPVDHVPGMMLLEAARQATVANLGYAAPPLEVTGEFMRYAELDTPCLIESSRLPGSGADGEESVLVTGHQDGEPVFRSTVTMAAPTG
ncbi:ScbA/BarX family gamma-butyrolactone biosynthesis protein [Streptomyces sp. NPDC057137]|uniref:ScbA/BarX family gamma-butyrolactone biosynthesis protein n=1 Tax=Streptomyces sp. NPDC057137 TaxID=3346030 RepID=UPI00362A6818